MLASLLGAIDAALEGRTGRQLPSPPWSGWLAVALLRQRERQGWHRFIVDTRLRIADREDDEGEVPGLPGWRFYFHGNGCCLTGPDGESIDVDRNDDRAAIIDPYFFTSRVASVRARRFPEMRLWRWLPGAELIIATLAELRAGGALVYRDGDHFFCLAPELEARVAGVRVVDFDDAKTQARWRAALGDTEDPARLSQHRRWLQVQALDPERAYAVLDPAREVLLPGELLLVCLKHLSGRPGPAMGKAIEALSAIVDDASEPVLEALARISPSDDPPYAPYQALAYLLERGHRDDGVLRWLDTFAAVEVAAGFRGNPFQARYAVLALRFLPERAMALVRRALRSSTSLSVGETAAMLAAIGQPWCSRELVAALAESPGQSAIAAALRASGGDLAGRRAAGLYTPPVHDPTRAGYTWEEVQHHSADALLRGRLREAAPVAEQLRERYPAGWEG